MQGRTRKRGLGGRATVPYWVTACRLPCPEGHKNHEDLAGISGYEASNDAGGAFLERAAFKGRREVERALRKLGIIYQDGTTSLYGCVGEGVYIANSSEEMSAALAGTAFQNWKQHSARVGEPVPKNMKIDGQARRSVFISL